VPVPGSGSYHLSCRKIKDIDRELFRRDLRASRLCQNPPESIVDLVTCYNTTLSGLLDKHAPLKEKTITVRPRVPWFNVMVKEAKRICWKHERIWRKTGSELDRERFAKSRNRANHVMEQLSLTCTETALLPMENCLRDIRNWMITDRLMINDEKTEFMLIGTKAQLAKVKNITLTIGESVISPSEEPIKNLGAWFDRTFNLNHHINKTCRSAFYHLHNIRRIRKYLSRESTEKLVHAFVTSHLDYCNGLLYGLPNNAIAKLQRVQNAAARILYRAPQFSHITPLLYELHWLPVKYRIEYKIITLTFKFYARVSPETLP
ncbi:Hypothetical predicted protein, partial [Paramuricea clavata]